MPPPLPARRSRLHRGFLRLPALSIGFLSFLSLAIVTVGAVGLVFNFATQHRALQEGLIYDEFNAILRRATDQIQGEVARARENVSRLHAQLPILDLLPAEKSLPYLQQVMAENIRFQGNEYNTYFAFERERSRRMFGKDGLVFTVHRDLKGGKGEHLPGNCVAEVFTDTTYQTDPKEQWYHLSRTTRDTFVTPVYFDESYMKKWMFTVARGFYEGDRFEGTAGVDIPLDGVLEPVEEVSIGSTGGLMVVNHETGRVLNRNAREGEREFLGEQRRQGDSLYGTDHERGLWQPVLRHGVDEGVIVNHTGQAYVVSARKVADLPWTVVAFQARSELQQSINHTLWAMAAACVLLLAVLGAVSLLLARQVGRPIRSLVATMETVKDAQVTGIRAPVGGTAETRTLGTLFNHMLERIAQAVREREASYAELEEMNRTLEQRVAERTSELVSRNHELQSTLQQLSETQGQLVAKEKLASLGALTAGIAHEIKNPLNFVINFSELSVDLVQELRETTAPLIESADEGTRDDLVDVLDTLEQNARKISEHGKRADSIVRSMLLHSRGRSGEIQAVVFDDLVDEYARLAYHGMRAADPAFNVDLQKSLDPGCGRVDLVPQDFGRALLNLVNNALFAAHDARRIREPGFAPRVVISTRDLGDRVEVRVRDNGCGVSDDVKEKMFNPFFTTKAAGVGTGLGLSLTHDIIAQVHRGEIHVDSDGSTFTEAVVTIPRRKA